MSTSLQRQQFRDRFFGPGNNFGDGPFDEPDRAWLQPWYDDVLVADLQATILPRWWNGKMVLYGLAPTGEALGQLHEDAASFLHPTYAQVEPPRPPDPADPIEQAIAECFTDRTFTIILPRPPLDLEGLKSAFGLLRHVRGDRPAHRPARLRPPGLILRDFEFALQQADEPAAQDYLQELARLGVLSRDNHRFLWVRLTARFRHWDKLVEDDRFSALQHVPRPAAVTDAMLEAVFHTELADFDLATQSQQAVEHVREHLLPFHGTLLSTAHAARSPGACKLALLLTIAGQEADPDLLPLLRTRPGLSPADHRELDAIAALANTPAPSTTDPLTEAQQAYQDDRYSHAFTLALHAEPGLQQTVILVRSAFELSEVEPAQHAWAALAGLTPAQRAELPANRSFQLAVDWLEENFGQRSTADPSRPTELPVPTSWSTWLARVDADSVWEEALAMAERGASQWAIDDFAADPNQAHTLAGGLLKPRTDRAAEVVHEALPHLRTFLNRLPDGNPSAGPVHEAFLTLLVTEERHSSTDLALIADVTGELIRGGTDATSYEQRVEDLLTVWQAIASYRYYSWALDLLDQLALAPAPDPEARLRFLTAVLHQAKLSRHRLDRAIKTLLRHLITECGHQDVLQDEDVADLLSTPAQPDPSDPWATTYLSKRIGIYTLEEPAAIRAREILTEIAPGAAVILNHDKTATPALRNLARSADYLVVVTRSARHAATDCIMANRSPSTTIYHTQGKGTSSILNALRPQQ